LHAGNPLAEGWWPPVHLAPSSTVAVSFGHLGSQSHLVTDTHLLQLSETKCVTLWPDRCAPASRLQLYRL
jgi:hypothetical protein